MVYTINDKIGRRDSRDIVKFSTVNVTTTPTTVPPTPLGRRNYILIKNVDESLDVNVSTSSGIGDTAYILPAGTGTWEENTDGTFYVSTVSGIAAIIVYERAARFNYS